MNLLEGRLLIIREGEKPIEDILDNLRVDYDWDSGDRLMVKLEDEDEIIYALESAGYYVDVIY